MQVMDRIQAQQNADRDFNYTIGRDSILDKRYEDDTTYNRGRDAVSDARYEDETSYNRSQDAFDNGLKLKQLDIERYKAYKSKADDEALTEDDVKSEAYVQFYKALDDGKAYVWLTENRDYILRTFSNGASVYNDMMKTFQEKAKDPTYPKAPDPLKLAPHLPG
jgi:hypothetical protein